MARPLAHRFTGKGFGLTSNTWNDTAAFKVEIRVVDGLDWAKISSLADVDARLRRIIRRSKSYKRWFEYVLTPVLFAVHAKHFKTDGAFGRAADKWAEPYSLRYAAWKRKAVGHYRRVRLGIDSISHKARGYRLMESLTSQTRFTLREIRKDSFSFGSKARNSSGYMYVGTQQWGATTRKGTGNYLKRGKESRWHKKRSEDSKNRIPPRPPVVINLPPQVFKALQASFMEWITTGALVVPRI